MSSLTPQSAPPAPSPPPTRGALPRWVLIAFGVGCLVIVALLVGILALLASSSHGGSTTHRAAVKTFTVSGELTLTDAGVEGTGGECYGTNGYDDMQAGAQVVVRDADGKTVGVGQLGAGAKGDFGVVCTFPFTVEDVRSGVGPYSVEVSHRGQISFPESEARDVSLSLG